MSDLPEWTALKSALYPLSDPPMGEAWNQKELIDLLPVGRLAEAAVLVGLVPRTEGVHVLLTRRNDALRHHAGQVSFPGGRAENGDDGAIATATRESCEEIGLRPEQIAPLGYLDPFATTSGFRVIPVVAAITSDYIAKPDPAEVADVFEVPLYYLMTPENLRHVYMEYRGHRRMVLEYDWPGYRIWGATASILCNLRQRLENSRA
ncbi:MAG: CoA pyrophosphatase [Xanthomonadaceae bacterium]|nr:CoA pyrophosphatase [Xanthomonadaceae bacterium]